MSRTDVIRRYVAEVMTISDQLKVVLGAKDLLAAVMAGKVARRGSVGDLEYDFHGYGCRVMHVGGTVDFEFGTGGVAGGFDAWRIWSYAKERGEKEFASLQEVEKQLADLEVQGAIIRRDDPISPGLYYFK
jgi:hypothetical protein